MKENQTNIIGISVKDIIEGLADYTGINKNDINAYINMIRLGYYGIYSFNELVELLKGADKEFGEFDRIDDKSFTVTIYSNKNLYSHDKNQEFCYDLKIALDFDSIQADGKSLIEHCKTQLYYDDAREMHATGLVIDIDVKDLIYKVNLDNLQTNDIIESHKSFYPAYLFNQVIINYIENKNQKKKILK